MILLFLFSQEAFSQESEKELEKLTKQDILELSLDELLELNINELLIISKIVGVSIDELFELVHETHSVRADTLRSQFRTAVPIEVIPSEMLENSGYYELGQVLQYLVPTFHSTHQTIADGTDSFDPASLRGLGPDQILILINGKRRHNSSYLHINGTVGRGTVGTDLNTIPLSAIERIEIRKNGAAAQYGSDAIAGVINILLKEKNEVNSISFQNGISQENDGRKTKLEGYFSHSIGKKGYLTASAEFYSRGKVNRSGDYTGSVFDDERDKNLDNFFSQTPYDNKQVMSVGSSELKNSSFILNSGAKLNKRMELYSFASFNYKNTVSAGFYRFPKDDHKVVLEIYPNGYSPELHCDIFDLSFCTGIKHKRKGWNLDLSNNIGRNFFDLTVKKANNASMGRVSPTSAYCGGFDYWQNVLSLDVWRKFDFGNIKTNLAFGSEFRIENYKINNGEQNSWINGNDTSVTNSGILREVGFQYYSGFRPENKIDRYRTNTAFYIDIENDIWKKILINFAIRYEDYSDFSDRLTWKIASSYTPINTISLRAAMSTGFRAPSLQQVYYNKVSTQFLDGKAVQVVNFNNESSIAKAFGIEKLKPEISTNYSAGFVFNVDNFSFSADAYYIEIKDRIVLSGRFKASDSPIYAAILDPINVSQAQFFTNAIDTKTQGIDFAASFNTLIGSGNFFASLACNFTKTQVDGNIRTSNILKGKENVLFNREEISRIESAQPSHKIILTTLYKKRPFVFTLKTTHFGEVKYIHPDDENMTNWLLNENSGQIESRDQLFSSKLINDFSITWQANSNLKAVLGVNNIFDIYPDAHKHSANINNGIFTYSRRVQQFGVLGRYFYAKIEIVF